MKINIAGFTFGLSSVTVDLEKDFVAKVPSGLTSKDLIFDILYAGLHFPYFGFNWDALEDCLCDLSWIPNRRVIIEHEDVPHVDQSTLLTYLEVLHDSAKSWKPEDTHELLIVFPETAIDRIALVIESQSNNK